MSLRENLEKIAKKVCSEAVESSADMIADNTSSFDEMGMATVKPGEFAQEEITDQENLINKANMSNDNNFNNDENNIADIANEMLDNMLDISEPEADVKITTIMTDDECPDCHKKHIHSFGESTLAKALNKVLNGRTFEQYLKEATDYAGPKDWNPDMRINVSEVLKTLKDEIGEGSEGIHVDQLYDEQKNNCYKVSQIDKNKLPKTLTVSNIKLKLDDDTYKIDSKSKDFPVTK